MWYVTLVNNLVWYRRYLVVLNQGSTSKITPVFGPSLRLNPFYFVA